MKILVTGATGFLGNYLINALLANGHEIIASSSDTLRAEKFDWFKKVDYRPYKLEPVEDDQDLYNYFGHPDRMIHLAWQGLPNYNNPFHVVQNLPANYFFLTNLIQNGLNNIAITGTCLEYGLKEGCLSEDIETNPVCFYGLAKDTLRKALFLHDSCKQISLKWIRLFYMYGEGQAKTSLFAQLSEAIKRKDRVFNMSKGEQIRDFLPISDVVDNCIKIALQDEVNGIINCCSGQAVSVRSKVESILRNAKTEMELNLGYYQYNTYEPLSFWGDVTKLNQIINAKRKR